MAEITLRKSKFDGIKSVLDKLKASFKDYDASLNELRRTAEGVDSDDSSLEDAINEIASSSGDEKEKVEKIQELNRRIEEFVSTAVSREKKARDEIVRKKKDFYKRYSHLKPECEKGKLEKLKDKIVKGAEAIWNWVVDNLDKIIAAIIIIAAIVICIVCPAALVMLIGAIAAALSAIMNIADMVCLVMTGKDIATLLEENGHGILAKIWRGTEFGLDIASIILPIGGGIKAGMEAGKMTFKQYMKQNLKKGFAHLKNFAQHPFKTLREGGKALWNGGKEGLKNFKNSCKENGFLKTFGRKLWGGAKNVTGIDDIENGAKAIKEYSEYAGKNALKKAEKEVVKDQIGDKVSNKAIKQAPDANKLTDPKLPSPAEQRFNEFKQAKQYDINLVEKNGNFNHLSKADFKYDAKDMQNRVFDSMGDNVKRDSVGQSVRNNMHNEFYKEAKTNPKLANQLKQNTGIDMSKIDSKSAFNKALGERGLTIHEDSKQHMMQVVPTWANDLFSHDGDVAAIQRTYMQNHGMRLPNGELSDTYTLKQIKKFDSFMKKVDRFGSF